MMDSSFFHNSFKKKLKIVRKVLFRELPYLMIPHKPEGMILPRSQDYVIGPIRDLIDENRTSIDQFVEMLRGGIEEYASLVASGAIVESGGHFGGADGATAFAMVRHIKPANIVEIGCGQSTHVMRRALEITADDQGNSGKLVCIDPMPRKEIEAVADTIHYKSILEVERSVFADLGEGDILFIDGSHYAFNGTDATYLFLEILPLLKPGVIVHVHDIFLPYEYPEEFSRRLYNEQHLLAALILNESKWDILVPVHALTFKEEKFGDMKGGSFWFRSK